MSAPRRQLREGDDHGVGHYRERDQQGFVAPSGYRFDHDASPELISASERELRAGAFRARGFYNSRLRQGLPQVSKTVDQADSAQHYVRQFASILGKPRKYPARVALEDLAAVRLAQWQCVQIAFGIVEVLPCFRIDPAHRADHFRAKQDVVD